MLQGGTQKNLAAVKAQVDFIKGRVPDATVIVHKYADIRGAIGAALEVMPLSKLPIEQKKKGFIMFFKLNFNFLMTRVLLVLSLSSIAGSQDMLKVWQTKEFGMWYDPDQTGLSGNDLVRVKNVSQQLQYFSKLGYTHTLYFMHTPNVWDWSCSSTGEWTMTSTGNSRFTHYLQHVKDSLYAYNFKIIPSVNNLISHEEMLVAMNPRLAAIPPIQNILYLRANSTNETNSNFSITIKNKHKNVNNKIYVYVAYLHSIPASDRPLWLTSSTHFERVNTHFERTLISDNTVDAIRLQLSDNTLFDWYRSIKELSPNDTMILGKNRNDNVNSPEYIAFFAKTNYNPVKKPSDGDVKSDSIGITIANSNNSQAYSLRTLNYFDTNKSFPYATKNVSNSTVDLTAIWVNENTNSTNMGNISSLLSYHAFMKNSVSSNILQATSSYGCLNWPVIYNQALCLDTGNTYAGNSLKSIFKQNLNLITNIFGANTPPEYINIGYDELGYDQQPFVFDSVSSSGAVIFTAAQRVAATVAARVRQVDAAFPGKNIKILLIGDSFVPNDYGSTYKLCGDITTGNGGVLQILKDTFKLSNRLIINPWTYSMVDGTLDACRNQIHDKWKQIEYLNKLGYKFMPYVGEDGGTDDNTLQCTFEWARACENFNTNRAGYVYSNYQSWASSGDFSSVIPYIMKYPFLAKTYAPDTKVAYSKQLFAGLKFKQSKKNFSFQNGIDYYTGLALKGLGSALISDAVWNSNFTMYSLKGTCQNDMVLSPSSFNDNALFAFQEKTQNFIMSVKIPTAYSAKNSKRKGIMLRESLLSNSKMAYFHYYLDSQGGHAAIYARQSANGGVIELGSFLTKGTFCYLKVIKNNSSILFSASNDGVDYVNIYTATFLTGTLFAGLANVKNNDGVSQSADADYYDFKESQYTPNIQAVNN